MLAARKICRRDYIAAFVDDELEPSERAGFEGHLRECAECQREVNAHLDFLHELDSALAEPGDLEVPADFARVVAVHAENDMRGVRQRAEHRRAVRYCLILGLIAFALLGVAASRGIFLKVQLFFKTSLGIISLVGKTIYDAFAGLSVLSRVFRRGFSNGSSLTDFVALLLFGFGIGLLAFLMSRYRRTRVVD